MTEEENMMKRAHKKFFDGCNEAKGIVIDPNILYFKNKTLFLSNRKVSESES